MVRVQAEEQAIGREGEPIIRGLLDYLFFTFFVIVCSSFVFTVDGRSDFGPGRSKGGGIYGNGQ